MQAKRKTVRRNGVLCTIPVPKEPFNQGDPIEFQREVDASWERGTYLSKVESMKGWHRVQIASGSPPVVKHVDGYHSFGSLRTLVPTRRLRHVDG